MTPFETAVAFTLREETGGDHTGALHTDPADPGGTTKWGIAQRYHPNIDVAKLTRDQAVDIYRQQYWKPAGCEFMIPPLAVAAFDCAVLQGTERARDFYEKSKKSDKPVDEFHALRIMHLASRGGWGRYKVGWTRRVIRCHRLCVKMEKE